MATHSFFAAIFHKGDNFWYFVFGFPAYEATSEKMFALKVKEITPKRSKFFPFKVDPFSEGSQKQV